MGPEPGGHGGGGGQGRQGQAGEGDGGGGEEGRAYHGQFLPAMCEAHSVP